MEVPPKDGVCARLGLALDCRAKMRSFEDPVARASNHANTSWAPVSYLEYLKARDQASDM